MITYDDEGNRLTRGSTGSGDPSISYEWDYRDRLTTVIYTGVAAKTVTYVYDTNDLRIAKFVDYGRIGSVDYTEWFVNDGQNVLLSVWQNGALPVPIYGPVQGGTHRYLHGPEIDQVFADEGATGAIQWALADLNGSVRDVAGQNSATDVTAIPVENHRTFDSFGVAVDATTRQPVFVTDGFAFGYTGREYDVDTGLQYNRARWYDAAVGRFVSEDPIGFSAGDANLNRYAFNSPLTNSDPSGNSIFSSLWKKATHAVKQVVQDVGDFFENTWKQNVENLSDAWDWVEDAAEDTGDFFEEQWENGNIQKALLAASVVLTARAAAPFLAGAGAGLMSGGLVGAWTGFVGAGITAGVSTSVGAFTAISGPVRNLVSVLESG